MGILKIRHGNSGPPIHTPTSLRSENHPLLLPSLPPGVASLPAITFSGRALEPGTDRGGVGAGGEGLGVEGCGGNDANRWLSE